MPDSPLASSRVLVTGASGLIGSHVLKLLDGHGDVVAVSRSERSDSRGVRWVQRDLEHAGSTAELVDEIRPDVIIHLAGAVRGDRTLAAVGPTLRTNLVATVELLESATECGCARVVLSGSLLEEPATSHRDATPPSPYGAARWAASAYGRMFHALFATPVVILRPSYVYGPGQENTKVIPHVITTLLNGGSPALSTGTRVMDWVFAEDVARAYLAAASHTGIEGQTLDIGSGITASVREVIDIIVDALGPTPGSPQIGALPVRPLEQDVWPDTEATAAVLGWRATTPLDEGLQRTVAWFRGQSLDHS